MVTSLCDLISTSAGLAVSRKSEHPHYSTIGPADIVMVVLPHGERTPCTLGISQF